LKKVFLANSYGGDSLKISEKSSHPCQPGPPAGGEGLKNQ